MDRIKEKIWASSGDLKPFEFAGFPLKDVAIVIVNRNRRDLTDYLCTQLLQCASASKYQCDLFVVDIGSHPEQRSNYTTIEYDDVNFRGKCYAHNVGVRQAMLSAKYRYVWVLMNDLRFDGQVDAISTMIEILDAHPEIGILSPTNVGEGKGYAGASPQPGQKYRKVPVCDYLALMMRSEVLREVGFLNPAFRYCWGAIHELSYKIYKTGKWCLAYCDVVSYEHLGGTTYGKTENTISRQEYIVNAKAFAAKYFSDTYGHDWDIKFSSTLPHDVTLKETYSKHRAYWEEGNGR